MSTIAPRTATVTIYGGDYLDRIRHLERRAAAARDAGDNAPQRAGERPEYLQIAEEHDALVAEAEAQALNVTLKALGRRAWKALVAEHPPRDGNDGDKAVGVNEETFKDALVPVSIMEPTLTEDDLNDLSDVDYDRLYFAAFALNRGAAAAPKAGLVSRMTRENSATSD